jgi:serine protease
MGSKMSRCFILPFRTISFIALLVLLASATSYSQNESAGDHVPDEIIIKFKPDTPEEIRGQIIDMHNCSVADICTDADLRLLKIPESETPENMIELYSNHEEIEYAEKNYYVRLMLVPNDELFPLQWNFYNDVYGGIQIEAAWDIQTGDPNVIIAVIDSGVAYENFGIYRQAPDLARTHFVPGYDFVNNDSHPNDDNGHGTHVTGVIAQSTNNGIGCAGVAFNCSIMPVKVMDSSGSGTTFTITRGIYFAAANGAKVFNMSLGTNSNSQTMRDAIAYAYSRGVIIVCAAGNDFEEGNPTTYPAAYDDYVIAVGATRFDQTRSFFSNTGSYLDITAPGGDLNVDQNGDGEPDGILQQTFSDNPANFGYYFAEGTSSATPHVSGAAALLVSNGLTDPNMIWEALEQSAVDVGTPGWDEEYGWGILNVWAALNYAFVGDLNHDKLVTFVDLVLFADQWLSRTRPASAADFNHDGIVNFLDYALLVQDWVK